MRVVAFIQMLFGRKNILNSGVVEKQSLFENEESCEVHYNFGQVQTFETNFEWIQDGKSNQRRRLFFVTPSGANKTSYKSSFKEIPIN